MSFPEGPTPPSMAERQIEAKRLEQELKRLVKGWLTPGSGNQRIKGDVHTSGEGGLLCECKYSWNWHPHHGYWLHLQLPWLETVWTQARAARKVPVLALGWGDGRRAIFVPAIDYQLDLGGEPVTQGDTGYRNERYVCLESTPIVVPTLFRFVRITLDDRHIPSEWIGMDWPTFAQLKKEAPPPPGADPKRAPGAFRRGASLGGSSRLGGSRKLAGGGFKSRGFRRTSDSRRNDQ